VRSSDPKLKKEPLVLAFDIGTSSLRTTLFTTRGERLVKTTTQETYRLRYTNDGGAELMPTALRKAARDCLVKTLSVYRADRALRGAPILGVGTSCFWHSLIGVGDKNKPLTPVYTWADSRCRPDAAKLRDELGEREVHARTGCMVRTSFWPARLAWLRRTQPKSFSQVPRWMSPAEWLYRELLDGEVNCSFSMASGTGLFNAHTLAWDAAMLERCELDETKLNPISESSSASLRSDKLFPELKNVPWFPAIGDGAASNLGSGATHAGLAAINVGTSAALRVMRTGGVAQAPFGLFCYRVDDQRYLIGGAVSNAGNLRAWCLRELRLDEAQLEPEMARRPMPGHGLTVLPFWSAERAPTWEEDRRGLIEGITFSTTALDLLQAITEASYFRIARIAELVLEQEKTAPKFIVSGGIQRSKSALQRLADVLNQPVYPNDEPEASIQGAAVYALQKLGFTLPDFRFGKPIKPRAVAAEKYAQARARQQEAEVHPGTAA
jgi:gluconokinase